MDDSKQDRRISLFSKYLEVSGKVFDRAPLKYASSGYWAEKFARKGRDIINEFEEEMGRKIAIADSDELKEIVLRFAQKTKRNDTLMYLSWLPTLAVSFPLFAGGGAKVGSLIGKLFSENIGGGDAPLIAGFGVGLLAGGVLLHELACPSSIRKHYEFEAKGEIDLAEIVGKVASPSSYLFFEKKVDKFAERRTDVLEAKLELENKKKGLLPGFAPFVYLGAMALGAFGGDMFLQKDAGTMNYIMGTITTAIALGAGAFGGLMSYAGRMYHLRDIRDLHKKLMVYCDSIGDIQRKNRHEEKVKLLNKRVKWLDNSCRTVA